MIDLLRSEWDDLNCCLCPEFAGYSYVSYVPAHTIPVFVQEPTGNRDKATLQSKDLCLLTLASPYGP